jgi:hypothetical protein
MQDVNGWLKKQREAIKLLEDGLIEGNNALQAK